MDEDGRFTEVAGPELQSLSVMREGTDKGTALSVEMEIHSLAYVNNICAV